MPLPRSSPSAPPLGSRRVPAVPAVPAAQREPSVQRVYAIVPANPQEDGLRMLPDSPATWDHLRAVADNFSYWTVDRCCLPAPTALAPPELLLQIAPAGLWAGGAWRHVEALQ
jgi:hypothetical protein